MFFKQTGLTSKELQPPLGDSVMCLRVRHKLEKVIHCRYMLRSGIDLKSLIKYFTIPKGENNIRFVYVATANKLNECMWVPSFWLPLGSLFWVLDKNSWMAGGPRHCGHVLELPVTLGCGALHGCRPWTNVQKWRGSRDGRWAFWDRNLMGFVASPPFTWVAKLQRDRHITCNLSTPIDNERVVGISEELTWQADHTLAAQQRYLGMQDVARKLCPCSETPGAWSSLVIHVVEKLGLYVLTSEETLDKLKGILKEWLARLRSGETDLLHKELLPDRGFLVYITINYPPLVTYLKRSYLTIEMWRGDRDAEG